MKKLLLAVLLTGAAATAATLSADTPLTATAGATIDVPVNLTDVFGGLDPGDSFLGFGFSVSPNVLLSFTGYTLNTVYFTNACCGAGTDVEATVTSPFGLSLGDFTEPLLLATLHFTALSPGTGTFTLTADNTNLDQGLVYLFSDTQSGSAAGSIDITSASSVPEPSTLGAAFGGLALLVGLGRRLRK